MIKPSLETMSAVEVQQNLATLLNELADENKRVVIELNGTPIAILAPYEDFARLKRSDEVRAERHDFLEEFRSHFRDVDQDELQR
jgi:PHD/YefM family antitoxin component YafN of YafNO toxin-antitoxin module